MDGIVAPDWYRSEQTRDTADLAKPESLMLVSMRWWVRCYGQQECPLERLIQGMGRGGAPDAAYSINGLMWIVARTGQRPVDIRCPRCPSLSDDEAILLHAAWLTQEARTDLAERYLRAHLLTEAGAVFAIAPLEGLGTLFLRAGLSFGRRRSRIVRGSVRPAWEMPDGCSHAIH